MLLPHVKAFLEIKSLSLSMTHIPKLIGYTFRLSYHLAYISMRITIYPIIYTAISDKVSKFCCESTIYRTSLEIRRYQFKRWPGITITCLKCSDAQSQKGCLRKLSSPKYPMSPAKTKMSATG